MLCGPGCYEFSCDSGTVIWVGSSTEWGAHTGSVDATTSGPEISCNVQPSDCLENEVAGDFIAVSVRNNKYISKVLHIHNWAINELIGVVFYTLM